MKVTIDLPEEGLSPRARGNPDALFTWTLSNGPIPAGAGEPCRVNRLYRRIWAYPRGRGGTLGRCLRRQFVGAYPRGRGGTSRVTLIFALRKGLSPRARGNPDLGDPTAIPAGPIPAGAGEPA